MITLSESSGAAWLKAERRVSLLFYPVSATPLVLLPRRAVAAPLRRFVASLTLIGELEI